MTIDIFAKLHLALVRHVQIAGDITMTRDWDQWSPCGPGVKGRWRGCEFDMTHITTPGAPIEQTTHGIDDHQVLETVHHRDLAGLALLDIELDTSTHRYLMNADWLPMVVFELTDDFAHERTEMRRVALAVRKATEKLVPTW